MNESTLTTARICNSLPNLNLVVALLQELTGGVGVSVKRTCATALTKLRAPLVA